jgi:hypothetical protein
MANTTFNGPVRSQNGFQELVDGVWTPVGGGGGGSAPVVVFRTPGVQTNITLPVPTEVGQVYHYIFPSTANRDGAAAVITLPDVPGAAYEYMSGTANIYYSNSVTTLGPSSSGANSIVVNAENNGDNSDQYADIQIVYIGIDGESARFVAWPASYYGGDITTSRIF